MIENAQEPEPIILYGCDGEVYAIDDFLKNNLNRLTLLDHKIAEEILKAGIFKESGEHKELKSAPLTLSKDFGKKPILKAERKEGRLAYWQDIKFKGCNPISKERSYYNLTYRFGQEMPEIIASTWGVMELEEVLKEILATGFLILRDKPNALFPLYVYLYKDGPKKLGYCLVERVKKTMRVNELCRNDILSVLLYLTNFGENVFAQLGLQDKLNEIKQIRKKIKEDSKYAKRFLASLRSPVRKSVMDSIFMEKFYGKQDILKIDTDWYIEKQTDLLVDLHFSGIFRGVANSHQGNSLVELANKRPKELYLCDFDTTQFIEVPTSPSVEFMEKFYVASIIEVMEGDFRTNYYLEFKEIPDPFDFNPAYRDSLEDIYFKASALYQKYRKKLQQRLVQLGWDTEGMDLAIEKARNYYIYWDQLVGMMYTNLWKVFRPPISGRQARTGSRCIR